jgi:hypothetical protein
VEEIGVIRKGSTRKPPIGVWFIGNRDIGDPGSKGFVHFRIAKRDFPIRHRSVWATQESARRTGGRFSRRVKGPLTGQKDREPSEDRGSENRESKGCMHIDIANPETPMGSYMAVVIW